jgi:Rrf2 family nitric oxide-sensitive transcriptional repressor
MYLGSRPDNLATIEKIVRAYGISQNHFMKVVNGLARHGWVTALRGRGGGLRLAPKADEIAVGAVLRTTEEDFCAPGCRAQRTLYYHRVAEAIVLRPASASFPDSP